MTSVGLIWLAEGKLGKIKDLCLDGNGIGSRGAKLLTQAPFDHL